MRADTRKKFREYSANQARINGADSASESFAVTPSVQQRLEQKMQQSSAFLQKINIIGVNDLTGEKIGVGVSSTIAGRTDTTQGDRQPFDPSDLTGNTYLCVSTEFDTSLSWAKMDAWAAQGNFQPLVRNAILSRQALDRIMIGFNGASVAKQTDRSKNPLLQDVNKGWLQHIREDKPSAVMKGVKVGTGQSYQNLDALVFDAVNELIAEEYRDDPSLVAIVGRGLMDDKYFPLINNYQKPNEQVSADLIISQKRLGKMQAVQAPFMPAGTVLITSLDNLSIYYQTGGRRSYVIDNPKRKRVENYDSSNDAYVVEEYAKTCLIEGIELVGDQASPSSTDAKGASGSNDSGSTSGETTTTSGTASGDSSSDSDKGSK